MRVPRWSCDCDRVIVVQFCESVYFARVCLSCVCFSFRYSRSGGWGNTQSLIRHGNQGRVLASQPTSGILSSTVPTKFWVQLHNGVLTVGRGHHAGSAPFLSARVPALDFSSNINATSRSNSTTTLTSNTRRQLHIGFAAWQEAMLYKFHHYNHTAGSARAADSSRHPHVEPIDGAPVDSSYSARLLIDMEH